eukprot:CAMPEP_0182419970 /NCGR_PEP_ID=MMETSP1167-20130531/4400_1 /TAXON_ID=2988 /ORGANISM="Mallomonas Sp, Strain CCMP3275" /LENGTH=359 /DNA_ID=CAMNT_0024595257 /DNA_START=346 /DNA_END=1425 /DNA_ORIENTATION=-
MIWDDHQNRCIGELMFKSEVKAVRLRRDRVVVVLQNKVYVYRFSDLKLLDQINTTPNARGLVCLSPDAAHTVLACPGLAKGSIRVELYDIKKATLIKAHDSELAQIALNCDGSRIASASDKGTLIRVWDSLSGEPLRELRRGMDRAEIYCLSFSPTTSHLACSSDKGTIHVFSLSQPPTPTTATTVMRATNRPIEDSPPPPPPTAELDTGSGSGSAGNLRSGLAFVKGILPPSLVPRYFDSEWSFAQVRGLEGKSICAFDYDSPRIIILTSTGAFMTVSFENGGECKRLSYSKFIDTPTTGPEDVPEPWGAAKEERSASTVHRLSTGSSGMETRAEMTNEREDSAPMNKDNMTAHDNKL